MADEKSPRDVARYWSFPITKCWVAPFTTSRTAPRYRLAAC